MQKWIIATILGIMFQGNFLAASQNDENFELKRHRERRYASYWLTNQPSLTQGENVLFNLQQTITNIGYDSSTGIFTLPPGVYAINFFGTPNTSFENTLNLNVNGTIIPTPGLAGSMIVIQLSQDSNEVSVQATGNWSPQTGGIACYFFAYASIAIYQLGNG